MPHSVDDLSPAEPAVWDHPVLAPWPEPVRTRLRELWAGRARILAVAEGAERTLCHRDVWPANLADDAGTSALLDWAFAGEGAVGEDHACRAAKYSWFGPAMAVRAAHDDLGRSSYRPGTSAAEAIRRLTPLVSLIAGWAGSCA